jgi:threonine/homoserine/homoserine lactone efflux protein
VFEAIRNGALLGLGLSVLIGPVFFALLQTSIHKGFKAGLFLSLGISASDALYITLTNVILAYVPNLGKLEDGVAIAGGLVLAVIGVRTFLHRPETSEKKQLDKQTHGIMDPVLGESKKRKAPSKREKILRLSRLTFKGFLLNVAHPGVLLFWLSVVGGISVHSDYTQNEKLALYGTAVSIIFTTDLWKAFLASQIRQFLTYTVMLWLNRIMGVVLVIFGAILAIRVFV